jgi:serine phosphatase RsbU (regulator of sigma subunit)
MAGDVIVMVSDGIAEDKTDGKWIIELLSMLKYGSARELSELILNTAVKEKGKIADDMTVLTVQICNANADEQQESAVAE